MSTYEEHHRALRDLDNPYLGRRLHPEHEEFEWRTGPKVDEAIAAARRWDDHLVVCRRNTALTGADCICGYGEFAAALAALDKEAGRNA